MRTIDYGLSVADHGTRSARYGAMDYGFLIEDYEIKKRLGSTDYGVQLPIIATIHNLRRPTKAVSNSAYLYTSSLNFRTFLTSCFNFS